MECPPLESSEELSQPLTAQEGIFWYFCRILYTEYRRNLRDFFLQSFLILNLLNLFLSAEIFAICIELNVKALPKFLDVCGR